LLGCWMIFCGLDVENLFSLFFWVGFFSLFIFLVVEFLDDFFGVSLSCAFCVYCEKCGGVSFSLLLLLLLFFFFLFWASLLCPSFFFLLLSLLESYLQDVCSISIVCVRVRACFFFPANFVDRVVLTWGCCIHVEDFSISRNNMQMFCILVLWCAFWCLEKLPDPQRNLVRFRERKKDSSSNMEMLASLCCDTYFDVWRNCQIRRGT
jgi:hypothetical protein